MRIRDLYKVETLDTRFAGTGQPLATAQPSKWRSPEFIPYYIAFLTIVPVMFRSVYDVSIPSHPSYKQYEHLLEPGWIPGRKVDNSDSQYAGFRDNIPYMGLVLILHPLLRRAYEALRGKGSSSHANESAKLSESIKSRTADARLESRIRFDVVFALIFITALHGVSALKVLAILYLNYQIATALPKQYVAVSTWVFNIGVLFANELCHGYKFADIATVTLPPTAKGAETPVGDNWGSWIDGYGGLIPRWEILFNITVLRLIAFNFDHLWMLDRRASSPIEKKGLDPANLSERERTSVGAKPSDFTFRNYLAYVLYPPLYLTGPIINFNEYISQSRYPLSSTSRDRIIPYAVRFFLCLLCMELVLHYLYAVAISKSNPDWNVFTPFQLSMLGYFNLHIIWLKLLLPWRFFRLWSLVDGIDPPENMVRCMSDNYSALAFWRGWHRSFNRFVVRYIYVPLGGSGKTKFHGIANFLAVFTFVALWHDINLRLLMWGWLITLFVLPEVIATLTFPARKWKDSPNTYRVLCAIGAVGNILMMMAANLVGFAVGLDGLKGLVDGIVGSLGGRIFLVAACATLFVGVQVMFEVREAEKRRGVNMKC
ncbi:Glycerol uptake protein 1 [Pseudocercospora fuligena]|uniref:Glycerol uptake protein 1 n=1 Tax=Pseudocercospora fuligena TaxID=685502 RepID=A0A8H6VKM2_9PEZI|nr:Glycerol uptake protein 1 [Pseudocercospora fuligena]